ncbi:DUF6881 domain-containing protein [Burkholderia vietnamiensis]|uniref:DUF6881 domain-containing protein n=1 Tax=Burkholderia vietnamiensis TaxID=60552 RepID=UPI00313327D3
MFRSRYASNKLDADRCELRQVEVYVDENIGLADRFKSIGGASLNNEALPSMAGMRVDPQFEPVEIAKQEFEVVWGAAILRNIN